MGDTKDRGSTIPTSMPSGAFPAENTAGSQAAVSTMAPGSGEQADDSVAAGMLSDPADDAAQPTEDATFEPMRVDAYLRKVKGMLTGLAPSTEELARVSDDPQQLKGLIGEWQQTPEYHARMVDFFTMAFQQGEVTAAMVANVTPYEQGMLDPRVIQSMRESFGRTAMRLVEEGRPFHEVLTTRRFMLTPALMVALAWLDERQSGDGGGGVSDALNNKLGDSAAYTMQGDRPIPLTDSANPDSPDYLTFYAPQVAAADGDCAQPFDVDLENRITLYTHTTGETMMMFFMGSRIQRGFCVYEGPGILTEEDFTNWRMMEVRQRREGEEPTWLYQIPHFRNNNELVFSKPRVGFYTTPAFLYTWQTNPSNQARVTANQTLIAAVGRRFDASFIAEPVRTDAIATEHAVPGSACYGCHVAMDPMRQFFRTTYSYYYGVQEDRDQLEMPGVYVFDGESRVGANIADLGTNLAQSSWFAKGWTHKLCTWANAAICDPSGNNQREPTDPEFLRIVQVFQESNYSWNTLVAELFTSPLVTMSEPTLTTDSQPMDISVAKKAQLCRQWDHRLGLDDVCGLRALPSTDSGDPVRTIASVLPADAYSRGQAQPSLANEPTLFFFAGVENICKALSRRLVDSADHDLFQSEAPETAVANLVQKLMAIPAPADTEPRAILMDHYRAALAETGDAELALRSTFVTACLAPPAISVGQ